MEPTFMMYAMAHMNNPFPALEPRFAVPDAFEGWLHRMVAKSPEQRFQHAADAAWALSRLVDPEDDEPATQEVSVETESPDTIVEDAVSASWRVAEGVVGGIPDASRPPMPQTWQNVDRESAFRPMPGAGLGLMGIRPTPFTGRERERDVLWDTLRRGQSTTQIAVLHGPSGSGKTTLAQWLAYHAAECGAATVMYASHDRTPGARHGLGWLLASHYRAAGLPPDEMLARMRAIFANEAHGDIQARAATEIMRQQCSLPDEEGVSFLQLSSPAARHGFVLKCIAAEARRRPVIVWLDDIHFDLDSLNFVLHALAKPQGNLPVTFLLSVTAEDVTPEVQTLLDALERFDDVTRVALTHLDNQTVCAVLERMGLDEAFAKIVTTRSNGNALFAIQMVQDWVSRGHLRLENTRLVLDEVQAPVPMPHDVEEVWLGQLRSVAETFETTRTLNGLRTRVEFPQDQVWQSLELAAAFGREVDTVEWTEAARKLGLPDTPEIFDVLATRGLGALRDKNFTFVNERLRRLLADSARESDRWKKTNRALARMLTTRYGQDHPGLVLRVARHFVEAEDFAVASMCLDEAYTRAFRTGNQNKIAEVLDLQERCLSGAKTPETNATWGHLWLKRSKPLIWQPDAETRAEGIALLERAESIARASQDQTLLAKVLNTRGWLALLKMDYSAAIVEFAETLVVAPDHVEKAVAHRFLGQCYLEGEDDIAKAREHYELCATITRDPVDTFSAHQGLFRCAIGERKYNVARGHLSAADALATEHGLMLGAAFVSENKALLACEEGQWLVAAQAYRDALELQELLGTAAYTSSNRAQLARCLVLLGKMDQAQEQLNLIAQTADESLWDVEAALAVSRGEPLPAISAERRSEMMQSQNPVLIAVVSSLPSV
ncbi:MAG: AAA family ATPase [bacterium]